MSVIDDRDAVGNIHDLIQLKGDEQDGDALVALPDQHFVHILDRADVQAAGGLDGDQEFGLLGDLTADDDLLLVAAGQAAGQLGTAVLRTHIVGLDQLLRKGPHLFSVDPPARRELIRAVFLHDGIFIDGKAQDQAVLVAVRRNGRHTAVDAVLGIFVLDLLSAENDLALALFEVVDRLHELLLAVAVDAGDADDLAAPHLQIEILDSVDALLVLDIEVLDIQDDILRFGRRLVHDQLDGMADHHGRQVILRDTLDRDRIDVFAAADDRADI